MKITTNRLLLPLTLLVVSVTAANAVSAETLPALASVRIEGVPHVTQRPDFCGEACAAMALNRLGHPIDQNDVFDQAGLAPEQGRGCHTKELRSALMRIGFDVGAVWYQTTAEHSDAEMDVHFRALHKELSAGVPSIVCMHYDENPETTEHFRLIVGYDSQTDEVLYHEPAVERGAYKRMARSQFLKLWPLKYDANRWTVIRLTLRPEEIRDVHSTEKFTNADYAQAVMNLKKRMPEGFSLVIQRPFVVAGDESAAQLRQRASGTIDWAVTRLKRAYFGEDPDKILEIWLFKDKESYEKHTKEVFNDSPDTPYGYFSYKHGALIMNIATGGGTLVHEIVHPFIASNFPDCPSWFNEGLASLYEQCGDNRGQIWGYTNWRLHGLQKAIKPDVEPPASNEATENEDEAEPVEPISQVPSFNFLCHTTTYQFYYLDPGTNYAQARYLCYYLQQRGLLGTFYHQFRRNVKQDPSGYETLKGVLGAESEDEMEKLKEDWEQWVLGLRF